MPDVKVHFKAFSMSSATYNTIEEVKKKIRRSRLKKIATLFLETRQALCGFRFAEILGNIGKFQTCYPHSFCVICAIIILIDTDKQQNQ